MRLFSWNILETVLWTIFTLCVIALFLYPIWFRLICTNISISYISKIERHQKSRAIRLCKVVMTHFRWTATTEQKLGHPAPISRNENVYSDRPGSRLNRFGCSVSFVINNYENVIMNYEVEMHTSCSTDRTTVICFTYEIQYIINTTYKHKLENTLSLFNITVKIKRIYVYISGTNDT